VRSVDDLRHIEHVEQLKALAHDDRRAILRVLMARPATLTQLGERFGKHPAWIRHHVLALGHAGLAALVESRQTKGYVEKFYAATARAYAVDLLILPDETESDLIVVVGSDDLALDLLAEEVRSDPTAPDVLTIRLGSLEGLIALRHGLGHVAGCHLLDGETGEANAPYARRLFPGRDLVMITLARRRQCLVVAPGNPLSLSSLTDVVRAKARLVNRNRGSGTRVWIDRALAAASIKPVDVVGYEHEVNGHLDAAREVAEGHADVAVALFAAGLQLDLETIPLFDEQYDLVTPREVFEAPLLRPLVDHVTSDRFRREVGRLEGYDAGPTGVVTALSA
jgi:putative molybdopterin biosynthesis protein